MFAVAQKFLAGLKVRWSSLSTPLRLLVVACAVLVFVLVAPWLNELFFYVLARSYVNDIADVFNLNKHLAKAITLVVGATAAYLTWKAFSLSAGRRHIGHFGILGLLIEGRYFFGGALRMCSSTRMEIRSNVTCSHTRGMFAMANAPALTLRPAAHAEL